MVSQLTKHCSMTGSDICTRAIAYLKPVVQESAPAISVSREDSPVLQPFTAGLIVSYVVDAGDQLTFIRQRHLEQEGVSADQLHSMAVSNLQALAEKNWLFGSTVPSMLPSWAAILRPAFSHSMSYGVTGTRNSRGRVL